MLSRDEFKIVIGDTWRRGAADPARGSTPGIRDVVDFSRVRDVVDIVVDGASIAGHIEEDSVFFLIRDMLFAVEKLFLGDGKARISFYDGPWELVMQRVGRRVYVTMYRGGRRPEVLIKDQAVSFGQVARGVLSSSRSLHQYALDVDPKASEDPVVASMISMQRRVEELSESGTPLAARNTPSPLRVESTRWREARTEKSFSFGFRFDATVTDLLGPGNPQGSDLSSLLFRGQHAVHARGRRLALGKGYLFLQTERLLASLRQLLTAWEEGRPMSVRLVSEGLIIGVRLGRDDGLVITLMDSGNQDAIIAVNDLSPFEYADAVLGAARELRRLVVQTNPLERRNLRIEAFGREIRALSTWVKDVQRGTLINRDAERYRQLRDLHRTTAPETPIQETSRLRFNERWRVEIEGLDLGGTRLIGNVASIAARGAVLAIDTQNGSMLWRRETDRLDARYQVAGPDGIVRASLSGDIDMIDLETGALRWRTSLSPRSGGAPVLLVIEHGLSPGLVVAAEEERKLVALDMRTGEPRWRFAAARGGRFGLRRFGPLLYIVSNDGNLNAVDVETGNLVWRFAERTRFSSPPAKVDDTLFSVGGRPGRPDGHLFALDAFSGEPKWRVGLNGGALTAPIVADRAVLIPIRSGRRDELVCVDADTGEELWRRDCAEIATQYALMALEKSFIINAAGGVVRSLGARTGEEAWTTVLGPTCSDDVPFNLRLVLRGGVLFVPADTVYVVRPTDGHVIHTLGGEPPVPDLLNVDPNLAVFVAEDSGHIAMFDLISRLSVVS